MPLDPSRHTSVPQGARHLPNARHGKPVGRHDDDDDDDTRFGSELLARTDSSGKAVASYNPGVIACIGSLLTLVNTASVVSKFGQTMEDISQTAAHQVDRVGGAVGSKSPRTVDRSSELVHPQTWSITS